MKIAITGHRPNKLGNDYNLTSPLIYAIKGRVKALLFEAVPLEDWRSTHLITGMALGIDTLFAEIAIEQGLHFTAAIPFHNQDAKWPPISQKRYFKIINHPLCTQYVVSPGEYSAAKMQVRNQWMVDNCNLLIAVWDGTSGGTANCVKYAESVAKPIQRINPKLIEL